MTWGDSADDEAAIAAVLAGGFDAALSGAVGGDFDRRVAAAHTGLLLANSDAQGKGRAGRASTVMRVPVLPWGWADYLIAADAPHRPSDDRRIRRVPALLAIGVVAPGHQNISELAISHDIIPATTQAVAAGAGGVMAGGVIGGLAGWPGLIDAVAAVGLGTAGVTGQIAWYRSRIRSRRLSFRLRADDPAAAACTGTLAVLMRLTAFLDDYGRDMEQKAKRQRVAPIPLNPRTAQVPAAIHQALWELGTERTRDTGHAVLAAAHAAASAAVADVYATWRAFDSFLPQPLVGPDLLGMPEATPAADLTNLADTLEQERRARQLGINDVQQINTRLQP